MTPAGTDRLLEVEHRPEATVVRFKRRTILEPAAIQATGAQLLGLAGAEGRRVIVLNFSGVESLTSAMLGELSALHRTLSESGGRLAFCCVEPFLLHVFKVVKIPELIPIYSDETTALQMLAAETPE
jgi:anti-anti-sigma regulatory factor